MPDKGFTATFFSHTGKTHRQFNISGWKLHLLRITLALFVLLVSAAVTIIAFGLLKSGEVSILREEVSRLRDSLVVRRHIEVRLESIEEELLLIRNFRQRMEKMACLISPREDSIE